MRKDEERSAWRGVCVVRLEWAVWNCVVWLRVGTHNSWSWVTFGLGVGWLDFDNGSWELGCQDRYMQALKNLIASRVVELFKLA